jgi:Hg(II)-responsive transcriptional regulator
MKALRVGEVAQGAAVNLQTVRYYERRGLLPKPPRTASNYRMYPEEAVRRVRFIKRAQQLGFSLGEIKQLLSLRASAGTRCLDVRRRAENKLGEIEERIGALRGMQKALTKLIGQCSGRGRITDCPILEALDAEERK